MSASEVGFIPTERNIELNKSVRVRSTFPNTTAHRVGASEGGFIPTERNFNHSVWARSAFPNASSRRAGASEGGFIPTERNIELGEWLLRVISGIAKGHKLSAPTGSGTRPTADKVKEALFSIVQAHVEDSLVLDLFAGSGALGIEALSRGARHCDFVDESRSAAKIIQANLEKTRFENCRLYVQNAIDFLKNCDNKYDLVLLDPPYNKGLCGKALSVLSERLLVNEGGIIVCEVSADEEVSSPFAEVRRYKYGTVGLIIYKGMTL